MRRLQRIIAAICVLAMMFVVDAQIGTGPQPDRSESGRLLVPASALKEKERLEYNLRDNYCWLLAHTSVVVGNEIIVNDGMAKYVTTAIINGSAVPQTVEVPDLNAWTVTLPLDKDFSASEPPLQLWQARNARTHPPTNRAGLWSNNTHVFSVGGHFYNALRYNESDYFVQQDSIPPFEIWAGDVERKQWAKVDHSITAGDRLDRTVSGAATCIEKQDEDVEKCYYLGGYKSTRTAAQHPINWALSQRSMLEFNPETLEIRNDTKVTEGYGDPGMGYEFGTLHHIPVGCGSGILISLMGEQSALNNVSTTDDDLRGQAVNTTTIMIYDIDSKTWYHQKTSRGLEDERPVPRTRYCGAVIYSEATKSWDLWLFGGQLVDDPNRGVEDVHVLTIPKFQWVRVDIEANPGVPHPRAIRGHTCHAVNSQLIVIGGTGPGLEVDQGYPCVPSTDAPSLVNIIDLNTPKWTANYTAAAPKYTSPSVISDSTGGVQNTDPEFGWASPQLKELFDTGFCEKGSKKKNKLSGGAIAGIVIGGVAVLAIFAAMALWFVRRKQRNVVSDEIGSAFMSPAGVNVPPPVFGMSASRPHPGTGFVPPPGPKVQKKSSYDNAQDFPVE